MGLSRQTTFRTDLRVDPMRPLEGSSARTRRGVCLSQTGLCLPYCQRFSHRQRAFGATDRCTTIWQRNFNPSDFPHLHVTQLRRITPLTEIKSVNLAVQRRTVQKLSAEHSQQNLDYRCLLSAAGQLTFESIH